MVKARNYGKHPMNAQQQQQSRRVNREDYSLNPEQLVRQIQQGLIDVTPVRHSNVQPQPSNHASSSSSVQSELSNDQPESSEINLQRKAFDEFLGINHSQLGEQILHFRNVFKRFGQYPENSRGPKIFRPSPLDSVLAVLRNIIPTKLDPEKRQDSVQEDQGLEQKQAELKARLDESSSNSNQNPFIFDSKEQLAIWKQWQRENFKRTGNIFEDCKAWFDNRRLYHLYVKEHFDDYQTYMERFCGEGFKGSIDLHALAKSISKAKSSHRIEMILGDPPEYMDIFEQPKLVDQMFVSQLYQRVERHDCGPQCIKPPSEGYDPPITYNPFVKPLPLGFIRVATKFPRTGEECLICREEPDRNETKCKGMHIVYITPCGKVLLTRGHVHQYLKATQLTELSVDNFTFNRNFMLQQEKVKMLYFVKDISNGTERVPISVVMPDGEHVWDQPFQYNPNRRFDDELGLDLNEFKNFRTCCTCEDNCDSEYCECKQLTKRENCGESTGYYYKLLTEKLIFGIFECNDDCPCNAQCLNRVVQHGIRVGLQVFHTQTRGWGVRALHYIPRGTFICCYNGRVINDAMVDAYEQNDFTDSYLMDMDYLEMAARSVTPASIKYRPPNVVEHEDFERDLKQAEEALVSLKLNKKKTSAALSELIQQQSSRNSETESEKRKRLRKQRRLQRLLVKYDPGFDGYNASRHMISDHGMLTVEPSLEGNVARLFNHSCAPNMQMQNVFVETHDTCFNHMALFALRDIYPFEELTWDYNYTHGSDASRILYCECGAVNCKTRVL